MEAIQQHRLTSQRPGNREEILLPRHSGKENALGILLE
jgi:hypothetical protein